ncbi:alpha/beta fold hydrolase [Streptomyces sp. NPDC002623]
MAFFVRDDDVRLFHTDEGSGPAVLLLHGWACDSHDWSWQIPDLLTQGYRVIALDHRGHGRSSAPQGDYLPQTLADDAAALVEELGTGPVLVLGHSMGAVVGSALAVRRPDLVRALVLVDPVYTADDLTDPVIEAMSGPGAAGIAAAAFGGAFYAPHTPPFLRAWHRRRVLGTPDHVVGGCIQGLLAGEGLGRWRNAAGYLRDRTCPRLVVYADAEGADRERQLPLGPYDRVEVWEESGHFLHQENAERFNTRMRSWLNALPGAAS